MGAYESNHYGRVTHGYPQNSGIQKVGLVMNWWYLSGFTLW